MRNIVLLLFVSSISFGQSFEGIVNRDTVLLGNTFTLKYYADQLDGEFEAPALSGLNVISGPNSSMSLNIINGKASKKISYSITVLPDKVGVIEIESALLIAEDSTYMSFPFIIEVLPNPDGEVQIDEQANGFDFFNFSPMQPRTLPKEPQNVKPKRKIKRI